MTESRILGIHFFSISDGNRVTIKMFIICSILFYDYGDPAIWDLIQPYHWLGIEGKCIKAIINPCFDLLLLSWESAGLMFSPLSLGSCQP